MYPLHASVAFNVLHVVKLFSMELFFAECFHSSQLLLVSSSPTFKSNKAYLCLDVYSIHCVQKNSTENMTVYECVFCIHTIVS